MDPTMHMDLEFQLKNMSDAIQRRYALFVSCLCDCVKDTHKVTVENLRTFLLRLPALENDEEHSLLFPMVKKELKKANTINL